MDILEHPHAAGPPRTRQLHLLPPFAHNASGAQSSQFAKLFHRIAAADLLGPPDDALATQRPLAASALQALPGAVALWQTRHLLLVEKLVGTSPALAESQGLAHLRDQIDLPPRERATGAG